MGKWRKRSWGAKLLTLAAFYIVLAIGLCGAQPVMTEMQLTPAQEFRATAGSIAFLVGLLLAASGIVAFVLDRIKGDDW
jgi:hypothetical protein